MAKITSVFVDDAFSNGREDVYLNIWLDNGQSMTLILNKLKPNDPRFAPILSGACKDRPKTDGSHIFWRDGPSLSFAEIMGIVEGAST